ncbi:solute carrier family 22 member 8-like [Octopus vulgaris]|uniref:Solute carrier family 22 member 8-like n=1 Tax=Octopus vulgaris TaxID=6645 RepID=A0AA36B9K7_OCTVU|nr:solute carrier family 22 member 8-like [Octopus vulgaris]
MICEWDLVCNNLGLAESTQTVYALGQVVSGLLAPYLVEKYGRKPTRVTSNILLVVLNLIAAYSQFYWWFTTIRFFAGIVREAYVFSTLNLICELYAKERRIIMSKSSNTTENIILILYILAVAEVSGASCGDYIYISELYPTHIRSVGNGIATTFMRTVCMISPFLKLLAMAFPWAPGVIIGASCIVTSILIQVFLPETGNRVLPQRIEDLKMAEKKNKRNDIKMQGVS